jgi:hypothetical protein
MLLIFSVTPLFGQMTAAKDPTAMKLLSASVSALAGNASISDVTLMGTVTRTAGSDVETGSATLEALGWADSRVNLALTNGQQTEIINQAQGAQAGQFSGPDGTVHPMASQNCWAPASWFFTALTFARVLNDASINLTYIGQETHNSVAVDHIRYSQVLAAWRSNGPVVPTIEGLSTTDVFLDASDHLPVAIDFNAHPDKNAAIEIPVEIRYASYQKINGILVAAHIQKLINKSVLLDMFVTGASANTNLSPSEFAVATQDH